MTDSPISALDPAVPPLSDEMVPCVQDGENRRAPAAAFGIPIAGTAPPPAITQYQTWIDESAENPTLSIYLSPYWKPLYSFDANGAMTFASPVSLADSDDLTSAVVLRGTIDCSSAPNYPAADLGDLYVVSVAGKIGGASGVDVEIGDTLLCMVDGTLSGDQADAGTNWTIGQGNIDGAVTGPASATAGRFAQFGDTTGKVIEDGGLSLDTDGTLASDSDTRIASQKAVKTYVDTVAQGLDVKPSVKAASTASLTHSGEQTIDGVACVSGDRVLDKSNAAPALGGIWIVATGAWTRASDMDSWSEVPGAFCFVEQGTVNGNSGWTCTADQGGTLGTTAIPWTQFSGAGTYTAGSGISLSGTQFSAVIGSTGGSEAWSLELDAIAALGTNGIITRTAAHTYTPRSLSAPSSGMTITNADGVAGNPGFVLANDLAALENLASTGIAVRTGADAWAQRTLSQPAAGLAITNADGVAGNPAFALANDLSALEGLSATGFAARTATDTWAQRTLTQPASGMTISNSGGVAGNPAFALANDLAALEGLAATGIAVRTATDTWTQRAITGTSAEIAVTNGDGVSGAPTLGLPASLTFTGKTVTGGTFTSPASITGLPDPMNAQDAATKNYVDSLAQGLDVKPSVKAASTASLTHSGTQTIDGVACVAGDRVLDKNNTSAALNGIWIVASGAWTRAADMDSWSEIPGAFCFVEQGTANANSAWTCTSDQGGTLGTTAITWSQFAGPGTFTAGTGLTLTGTQFAAVIGSSGGSEAWSAELDAVAGLSTAGLVARTGAHAYAPRSMTAPVAGMTITNPDGVAGSPTFVLANDLLALENLSATGIAVRTGADAWAQRALTQPAAGLAITNPDGVSGSPTFALANDLAALEGLASTGIAVRTGADSWAQRSLAQPTAGFTVSNADGSAGNPTFTLANDLLALEGLSSTGIAVRTGTDAWTQRAITGTSGEIAVTNGDGVSGAPTLGLPASLTFTGKTVTGGTFTSPAINTLSDPLNPQDAATKNYVDTSIQGMNVKPSVKVASTSSLTHTGTQTIDGVSCLAGDRVLDKDNSSPALRGIWIVASGSWTRASDMDSWSEVPGAFCFAELGTVNAGTGWFCTAIPVGGTLGSTAMSWAQFAGPGTYTAGSGLTLSGSQFSSVIGSGGSEAWSAELDAVAALGTTGLVARTAAHTYTPRAITGTSGEIAVTNGDGVSGAPTLGLPTSLTFTGKTVTGGTFTSPAINTLSDPLNPQDAATKNYVDTSIQGMNVKPSVKAASTSSLTHSGTQTIDGVSCLAGDRVLDKDNSSPALRGIWIVASGSWTRASDMDSWSEVPGAFCFAELGTVNAGTGWFCTAIPVGGTLGSTAMVWSQFAGPGTYTAGSGLSLSGSQFSSVIGSSGGSEAWSAELDAVAALGTTGLVARTAAHAYTPRAITGTSGEIAVANGDGVSGAPTLGLPTSLTFTGKTVTGGTFTSPAAITGLPDPTNAQDAATKNYVDATAQGLDIKPSVKAATTASISHSGQQTIDGVFCIAGDRVLDKNNLPPALNGIWIVAAGAWIRATDMDSWNEVPGAFCFVEQGTTNADTGWVCTADQGGTMGTTAITWSQFAGVGAYSAGSGLALSGTQFSAVIGSSGGSEAWSTELDAVAALSTTGLVSRTAAHTYTPRTIQGPSTGNGLTVSNGDGIAGNPTIVPSDDLAALEALTGTNTIYYRSGTSTWSPVTVGGMLAFSGGTLNAAPSTDGAMGAGTPLDTVISSQKAIKTYVDQIVSAQDAMVFKGSTDCSGNPNYPAGNRGDTYRVSVAGKIGGAGGVNVEAGDLYICLTDGTASGNQTVSGANWTVAQANLDGAVIGPASAASANLATFSGTTGKLIQDSGVAISTDTTMSSGTGGSNSLVPTQHATVQWATANYQPLDADLTALAAVSGTNTIYYRSLGSTWSGVTIGGMLSFSTGTLNVAPSTDIALGGALTSDTAVSSQKAVRTYANANIGGQAISNTDTLAQGQDWVWDTASTTFKAYDHEATNFLVNSAFDVWQESASYAFGGSAAKVHTADFWKVGAAGASSYTASRVAGINNSQYAFKIQRAPSQINTSRTRLAQQFSQAEAMYLAGRTVTVSFDLVVGTTYTGSGPFISLYGGTGVDEDLDIHGSTIAFTTSPSNVASGNLNAQVASAGTVARIVSPPLTVPSGVTELALVIGTAVYASGLAGVDDSYTIANVKLELGNIATPYRKPDFASELVRCQRRYQKSFGGSQAPAQNLGTTTGEVRWRRIYGSTLTENTRVSLMTPMRISPALTLFNPSDTNAQVRNETSGVNCVGSAAVNVSDTAFEITCNNPISGGASGDWLGVHWIADARL